MAASDLAGVGLDTKISAEEQRLCYVRQRISDLQLMIPTGLWRDLFGPFSGVDGSDAVWHGHEFVASLAAGVDDVLIGVEDAIAEVVLLGDIIFAIPYPKM